jgi:hypothetical protein
MKIFIAECQYNVSVIMNIGRGVVMVLSQRQCFVTTCPWSVNRVGIGIAAFTQLTAYCGADVV